MNEFDTYIVSPHGWTCFHCGETFHGQEAARLHFGASIQDDPKCQISAHRLRAMELELRRYRDEDSDLHREIASLKSDHVIELRREEEKGFARGLQAANKQLLPDVLEFLKREHKADEIAMALLSNSLDIAWEQADESVKNFRARDALIVRIEQELRL